MSQPQADSGTINSESGKRTPKLQPTSFAFFVFDTYALTIWRHLCACTYCTLGKSYRQRFSDKRRNWPRRDVVFSVYVYSIAGMPRHLALAVLLTMHTQIQPTYVQTCRIPIGTEFRQLRNSRHLSARDLSMYLGPVELPAAPLNVKGNHLREDGGKTEKRRGGKEGRNQGDRPRPRGVVMPGAKLPSMHALSVSPTGVVHLPCVHFVFFIPLAT